MVLSAYLLYGVVFCTVAALMFFVMFLLGYIDWDVEILFVLSSLLVLWPLIVGESFGQLVYSFVRWWRGEV